MRRSATYAFNNVELEEHPNEVDMSTLLNFHLIMHIAVNHKYSSISNLVNLFRTQSRHGDLVINQALGESIPQEEQTRENRQIMMTLFVQMSQRKTLG